MIRLQSLGNPLNHGGTINITSDETLSGGYSGAINLYSNEAPYSPDVNGSIRPFEWVRPYSGLAVSFTPSCDTLQRLPTRMELWDKARNQVKSEELRANPISVLTLYNDPDTYERKVERRVIDLFLQKLRGIILSSGVSKERAERILNKLLVRFEYQIADYLGIVHERNYLFFKQRPIYYEYETNLFDYEYIDTEIKLKSLLSIFDENIRIPDVIPASERGLYHESDTIYVNPNLFYEDEAAIKAFAKELCSTLNIWILRFKPTKRREFFECLHRNIELESAISSFMYHKTSLIAC